MAAKRRRRRRSYRRNPNGVIGGRAFKQLADGAVNAFQVLAGKAVARAVPEGLNLPKEGATGIAVQAGVAIFAGMMARNMFGAEAGKFVMAGALTAPIESIVVAANIPVLSPALSSYPMLSAYPEYNGTYGVLPPAGMSAYPDVSMDEAYAYG